MVVVVVRVVVMMRIVVLVVRIVILKKSVVRVVRRRMPVYLEVVLVPALAMDQEDRSRDLGLCDFMTTLLSSVSTL